MPDASHFAMWRRPDTLKRQLDFLAGK